MNMKMCATSDVAKAWDSIDWNKANAYVKKLQMRIVKAHQQGRTGKVKSLQWLLTHSFYGRALLLLAQNAGIVFSKEQIYDCVWKEPYFGDYNIVMSHIRNLREKIEDNPSKPMYIQTVWGVGYRFNKNLSSGL